MTIDPGGRQDAQRQESASAHLRAVLDSAARRRTAAESSLRRGRARRRVLPAVVVTSVLAVTAGVSDSYVRAQVAPAATPAGGPVSRNAITSPAQAGAWRRLERQLEADKESMLRLERQGRAAERLSGRLLHQATALAAAGSAAPIGPPPPLTAPPTTSPAPVVTAPPTSSPPLMVTVPPATSPPTMATAPPTTTSRSPMVTAPPTTHATTGPSGAGG